MKTHDEIKNGLEHCINGTSCRGCPYCEECAIASDCNPMHKDLHGYIQQLQAENAEQAERIRQLEAERDAAVKYIKDVCGCMACNSASLSKLDSPCRECICDGMVKYDYWLWRGVQKED